MCAGGTFDALALSADGASLGSHLHLEIALPTVRVRAIRLIFDGISFHTGLGYRSALYAYFRITFGCLTIIFITFFSSINSVVLSMACLFIEFSLVIRYTFSNEKLKEEIRLLKV